jgi:hypothetical protein
MKRILMALALGAGVLTTALPPVLQRQPLRLKTILLKRRRRLRPRSAAEKALKEAEADAEAQEAKTAAKQASARKDNNSIFAKRKTRHTARSSRWLTAA